MRKSITLLLLALFACLAYSSDDGIPAGSRNSDALPPLPANPTLDQIVSIVQKFNPDLAAMQTGLDAAEKQIGASRILPNPELEAEVEDISDNEYVTMNLGIAQSINLVPVRRRNHRAAVLDQEILRQDYRAVEMEIRHETVLAFLNVYSAQKNLDWAAELLDMAASIDSSISERFRAGKDSRLESSRSLIEMRRAELERDEAAQEFAKSKRELAALWNSTTPDFDRVQEEFNIQSKLPGLQSLMTQLDQNPWVVGQQKQTELARLHRQQAKSAVVPGIDLGAGISHSQAEQQTSYRVGIGLPIPLFDRNQSERIAADAELELATQNLTTLRTSLSIRLASLYSDLVTMQNRALTLEREIIPPAETALKETVAGYEMGRYSYLDVLEMRRSLFDLRSELLEAEIAFMATKSEIKTIIGQRLETIE